MKLWDDTGSLQVYEGHEIVWVVVVDCEISPPSHRVVSRRAGDCRDGDTVCCTSRAAYASVEAYLSHDDRYIDYGDDE